jgi:hypothetical protein
MRQNVTTRQFKVVQDKIPEGGNEQQMRTGKEL